MTTKPPVPKIAYAVLNAATLSPFDHDGWCQVMPAGHVRARDGRPETPAEGWLINEAAFNRMVARVVALNQPIKIDYNHQTLFKPEAAPAAGFVPATPARFRWDDNTGVWVKPDWNPPALERLKNNEFPYFSPVMGYDARSGEPLELRMLAITGDPGLTGLRPVTALSAEDIYQALTVPPSSPKEPAMNQSLTALLAALGLTVPAGGELTDEVATAALSAVTTLKSQADKATALETTMAALSADLNALKTQAPTEAVDLRRYVPVETYNAVREQVVSLSADLGKTTLAQTLDKAEQDGRILKSERPYLEGLGDQIGLTALSAQLATRQPIAALTRVQTETLTQPPQSREKTATVALSAEELQAARVLGMTPAAFQKIKHEDAQ